MSMHTRNPLLPMTTLALAIALATGCSDRAAGPDTDNTTPAATVAIHDATAEPMHDVAEHAADEHAEHATATTALPTPPATPWASDAPLREGMRRMNQAVVTLGHAENGHLDAAQTSAAAQQVQDAANYMITNCKLAPEPDTALHGVLATLMTGAAAIKGDPANTTPVASMRDAVALYPRMFVDASWNADTAPAE